MPETDAAGNRLSRLLRPRSIAVLGGKAAAEVVRQGDRIGFGGEIWPVHPYRAEVEGRKAYRSIADLPAAPDATFLGINRHLTIEAMGALARRGAGGAVAYASGFSESGSEGQDLQARLIAAAGDMPFLGPNCYGFINYFDGALLWPDQHGGRPIERGVAIVTQSGNIGLNLTMQKRALPIGYLVTLGNQAAIGLSAIIEALLDDPRVTAIGLHIEGIDDPPAFARAAGRARRRNVPIVALKTGRSAAGARLAVSHTASLASADAVIDAFFRKSGIARVHSLPVLLESLKLLHLLGPLGGRDVASMSCSGGEAALIADAAEGGPLRFRPLNEIEAGRVAATLSELVTISNPLDYHTFSWGNEEALTETFAAMMAAGFDMTMLVLDFPRPDRCDDADWDISVKALAAASRRTGAAAAIVSTLPEALPETRAEAMAAAGIVPLLGLDEALGAIAAAADAGEFAKRPAVAAMPRPRRACGKVRTLSEWEGKQLIAAYGLTTPDRRLVTNADDPRSAAEAIGFPVVVKAVGADIAHKTEIGAVKLGLRDAPAVEAAASELRNLAAELLVEAMVDDAVAELIIGIELDPKMGPYLVIGAGGIFVELIGDSRLLTMPATREEIIDAIRALRVAKLLDGHRGRPEGDFDAVVASVLAVQSFAVDNLHRLVELDINPLIVRPVGRGAVAGDVLIRLIEESGNG